jgi:EAL domain-containing protein (putative c-di-GMP-specific phosphodiesterase class I)
MAPGKTLASELVLPSDLLAASRRAGLSLAALVAGHFAVFQPVVSLKTRETTWFEALSRVRLDAETVIGPAEFIPLAVACGLGPLIDLLCVRSAVNALARSPGSRIMCNLDPATYQRPSLFVEIDAILAAAGIGTGRLGFELREPVLAGDWESTRRMATMLASRGHPLALDDFRDAPLHILSRMPFTYVKVGANVMRLVRSSREWRAFLRSVAAAARSLGSTTVAEYVEDEEVLEIVLEAGVELGQGHLFGPALEFDRVCASDHY